MTPQQAQKLDIGAIVDEVLGERAAGQRQAPGLDIGAIVDEVLSERAGPAPAEAAPTAPRSTAADLLAARTGPPLVGAPPRRMEEKPDAAAFVRSGARVAPPPPRKRPKIAESTRQFYEGREARSRGDAAAAPDAAAVAGVDDAPATDEPPQRTGQARRSATSATRAKVEEQSARAERVSASDFRAAQMRRLAEDPTFRERFGDKVADTAAEMGGPDIDIRQAAVEAMAFPVAGTVQRAGAGVGASVARGAARGLEQVGLDTPAYELRELARKTESLTADSHDRRVELTAETFGLSETSAKLVTGFGDMLASGAVTSGAIILTGGLATPAMFMMGLGEIDAEAEAKGLSDEERNFLLEAATAYGYAKIEMLGEVAARPKMKQFAGRFARFLPQGLDVAVAQGTPIKKVLLDFGLWEIAEEAAQEAAIMGLTAFQGEDRQYTPEEVAKRLAMSAVGGMIGSLPAGTMAAMRVRANRADLLAGLPGVADTPEYQDMLATAIDRYEALEAASEAEIEGVAGAVGTTVETPGLGPVGPAPAEEEKPGLRRRVADMIDPSRKQEAEAAYTDPMTGLPNQTAFEKTRARRDADDAWSVGSLDLVEFKAINDVLGREAGDARLGMVAAYLTEEAEARGIPARDVQRAGGDEFAVWGQDPAVVQEVIDAAIARLPDVQAGEFTSSMRGAVGANWLEAEAATQALKAEETGPKSRSKTSPVAAPDPSTLSDDDLAQSIVRALVEGADDASIDVLRREAEGREDGTLAALFGGRGDAPEKTAAARPDEAAEAVGQALPWAEATSVEEHRWRGTRVEVAKEGRQEGYSGTVSRVLNGGALVEVTPDGVETEAGIGTFRVRSERVTVTELKDSTAEPEGAASEDGATAAREMLASKIQAGEAEPRDPEVLNAGIDLSSALMRAGARTLADLSLELQRNLGATPKDVAPHLRAWYNGARSSLKDAGDDIAGTMDRAAVSKALKTMAAPKEAPSTKAPAPRPPVATPPKTTTSAPKTTPSAPAVPRPKKPSTSAFGAKNTGVTIDEMEEIRRKLKESMGKLRSLPALDPELLNLGTRATMFYVEGGVRKFADVAKKLAEDFGVKVSALKPYLRRWYNAAMDVLEEEGIDVSDMDGDEEVDRVLNALDESEEAGNAGAEEVADDGDSSFSRVEKADDELVDQSAEYDVEDEWDVAGPWTQEPDYDPAAWPADPLKPPTSGARKIGDRLVGNLTTPPGLDDEKGVSAPKVLEALAKVAEAAGQAIKVGIGRLGTKRARGWWNPHTMVIRVANANNIATSTHELAHAFEQLLYGRDKGGPWKNPRATGKMQRELVAMGRELYGSRKPSGGYKREGWAEFIRMWVTETTLQNKKANLGKIAPLTLEWFENTFSEDNAAVYKALENAREIARKFRLQGSRARGKAGVVDDLEPAARIKRVADRILHFGYMEKFVEMANPLHELARAAEKQLGRDLAPSEDPFLTMSALRTTHAARAARMVESGMLNIKGEVVGPALNEISSLVKGRQKDFTIYLWSLHTIEEYEVGEGRETGLSLQDAYQIKSELETPQFELAAGMVLEWNSGVLDYAAQSSPSFAAVVDAVREKKRRYYMPLQREFEDMHSTWARMARRGAGSKSSPVARFKGSGRRIKEPFRAMIANAERTIRKSHERMVLDQIIKIAKVPGMGGLIEEVNLGQKVAARETIADLVERINREIFKRDPDAPMIGGDDMPLPEGLANEIITFFTPNERTKAGDVIVPIHDEGRIRYYEVDGKLFDTLSSLDVYRIPDLVGVPVGEWLLGKPAAAMRAGTTGLRASFGLIWNPMKDVQTLWLNTQAGGTGYEIFRLWANSMMDMGLARTTGKESEWVEFWMNLGGEMAQPLGQDIHHTRRAARRLFEGRVGRIVDPRNWFDFYRDLVQFPEGAPRVAELRAVAKKIGWAPGQPITLDQSLVLLLASKQVTTDFTAAGELARLINRMAPFHNAAIQGPRANIRAAKRNPSLFVWRGLHLSILTILLWWMNKDEDWYRNMEYRDRFMHWFFKFKNPSTGEEELARIPRAFEVGMVFAALPEMALDSWYASEPEQVTAWMAELTKLMQPNVTPVLMGQIIEQANNKDFYFDRPIVTEGDKARPVDEQFNAYTTKAAIALGEQFNLSPKRIDYAVRGIYGPVGMDILGLLGAGTPRDASREREPADTPLVGRMFQRGGTSLQRPRQVSEMYDALEVAQIRQGSRKPSPTPWRPGASESKEERELRLQLTDATQAVTALLYVRANTDSVAIRRALSRETAAIAKAALEATAVDRKRFADLRKDAQARREVVEARVEGRPPDLPSPPGATRRRRRARRRRR